MDEQTGTFLFWLILAIFGIATALFFVFCFRTERRIKKVYRIVKKNGIGEGCIPDSETALNWVKQVQLLRNFSDSELTEQNIYILLKLYEGLYLFARTGSIMYKPIEMPEDELVKMLVLRACFEQNNYFNLDSTNGKDLFNGLLKMCITEDQTTTPDSPVKSSQNVSHDHKKKLNHALKRYNTESVRQIFPSGKDQADAILFSLAELLKINLSNMDESGYHNLLTIYSDIWIRKNTMHHSDERIISSLTVKHSNYIKTKDTAKKVLLYCSMNMENHLFSLKTSEHRDIFNAFDEVIEENKRITEKNEAASTQNIDDPNYGLTPGKPIYTNGVEGSNQYLSSLTTVHGEKITWERYGSMSVSSVDGMIDVYDIYVSGKFYKKIYINMYSPSNSTHAPDGFKIRINTKNVTPPDSQKKNEPTSETTETAVHSEADTPSSSDQEPIEDQLKRDRDLLATLQKECDSLPTDRVRQWYTEGTVTEAQLNSVLQKQEKLDKKIEEVKDRLAFLESIYNGDYDT